MRTRQTICSDDHSDPALVQAAASHLLDGVTATRAAGLFKAFSDPTRVRIVGLLAHVELCVGDLCLTLGMSQPAVSHHLGILRSLRIVEARKEGKHVFYTLVDKHIHQLYHQGVDHVSHE